jgi:hypothetical protein
MGIGGQAALDSFTGPGKFDPPQIAGNPPRFFNPPQVHGHIQGCRRCNGLSNRCDGIFSLI